MRVYSEEALGIYRENIIGSAPEFAYVDGQLLRQNTLHGNISLGPGKLEHILRPHRPHRALCRRQR